MGKWHARTKFSPNSLRISPSDVFVFCQFHECRVAFNSFCIIYLIILFILIRFSIFYIGAAPRCTHFFQINKLDAIFTLQRMSKTFLFRFFSCRFSPSRFVAVRVWWNMPFSYGSVWQASDGKATGSIFTKVGTINNDWTADRKWFWPFQFPFLSFSYLFPDLSLTGAAAKQTEWRKKIIKYLIKVHNSYRDSSFDVLDHCTFVFWLDASKRDPSVFCIMHPVSTGPHEALRVERIERMCMI